MNQQFLKRILPPGPDQLLMPVFTDLHVVSPVIWEETKAQQHHADLVPDDFTYHYFAFPKPAILAGKLLSYETPTTDHPPMTLMNQGHNRDVVRALDRLQVVNRGSIEKLSVTGLRLGVQLKNRHNQMAAQSVALQFLCRLGYMYTSYEFAPLPPPKPPTTVAKLRRRALGF